LQIENKTLSTLDIISFRGSSFYSSIYFLSSVQALVICIGDFLLLALYLKIKYVNPCINISTNIIYHFMPK